MLVPYTLYVETLLGVSLVIRDITDIGNFNITEIMLFEKL